MNLECTSSWGENPPLGQCSGMTPGSVPSWLPETSECEAVLVSDGGGLSAVERCDETVRRRAGEWTPAVHALLVHLQAVGFAAAPRPVGLADGLEILSFVPGEAATYTDGRTGLRGSVRFLFVLGCERGEMRKVRRGKSWRQAILW